LLAVREKLRGLRRGASSRDLSKPDKNTQNNETRRRCSNDLDLHDDPDLDLARCRDDVTAMTSSDSVTSAMSSDRQQQLVVKCVKLLTQKHFLEISANEQVRVDRSTIV